MSAVPTPVPARSQSRSDSGGCNDAVAMAHHDRPDSCLHSIVSRRRSVHPRTEPRPTQRQRGPVRASATCPKRRTIGIPARWLLVRELRVARSWLVPVGAELSRPCTAVARVVAPHMLWPAWSCSSFDHGRRPSKFRGEAAAGPITETAHRTQPVGTGSARRSE